MNALPNDPVPRVTWRYLTTCLLIFLTIWNLPGSANPH